MREGVESTFVNRSDGLAVALFKKLKIPQIIISTETNPIVSFRAEKLSIKVFNGVENKKKVLEKYCGKNKISLANVVFVGNDLNDFEVMSSVGFPVAPIDAHLEIKRIARYVTEVKDGFGVVRDLYDYVIANKLSG